jgi:uncharacterized membrane protein YcaP (DUF421 family)
MELVLRTLVMFCFILLLTRAMGKKELAELTAFELILLITIGDLVQQGVTQEDQSLTGAMLVVGTIGILIVGLSYTGFRWKGARPIIEGLPVVVLRNGRPIEEALRLERLTLAELQESARHQGIGDLANVRIAILEPDGKFSFIQDEGRPDPSGQEHRAV